MGYPTSPMAAVESEQTAAPGRFALTLLYGVTIFCSAFLLFQIQPMIAKLILPWFGGAAAVWSICLLFFQSALLLGYLYAHALTRRFRPRTQSWIHIALLAASLLTLPILPRHSLQPSGLEDPAFRVLLVLVVSVGLPYSLLSSTSPLLQAWYSQSDANVSPYRFYALSNAGSLLALLSYPVLVEPRWSGHVQAVVWSVAYGGVALLCAVIALRRSAGASSRLAQISVTADDWKLKSLWVALAACGSALLLSITTYISQNIAAVPLIWIIPLSLYLLTFILCFEGHNWYRRGLFLRLLAVALAGMAYALAPSRINLPPYVLIPLFCGGLFACCMVCHGELAGLKPPPAQLTSFYLLVSLGGALGALFVALLAPRIFSGYYELPVALGFCGVLIHVILYRERGVGPRSRWSRWIWALAAVLVAALCVSLYVTVKRQSTQPRVMVRNFYGVLRVEDRVAPSAVPMQGNAAQPLDPDTRYRDLINGTIEHGIQFVSANRSRETTTYYGPDSGIAVALRLAGQQGSVKIGAIGLGAGTIAAYGRAGDQYTFYEINPLVVEVANNDFSFLRQSQARVNIVVGDARLSLEREPPQQFDVLAVDAFSSDAIPVHLLTREAFALYLRQVKPSGVVAVHVSNKYLDLVPVVRAAAASLDRKTIVVDSGRDTARAIYPATWILVGSEDGLLASSGFSFEETGKKNLWTDDYSSLLSTFK